MDDGAQPLQSDTPPQDAMLRMVLPAKGGGLRAVPRIAWRVAWRVLGDIAAWAVVALVLVLLFTPAAAFLVAGGWAVVTCVTAATTLYHLFVGSSVAGLFDVLRALDIAGRIAVTSVGYYALLSALVVLEAGLLGRRWRRLFLFPGIILTIPSALIFYFGLRMTLDAVSSGHPASLVVQTAITLYLLLDAVLLAAFLVDLRPKPRHARRRNRRGHARVAQPEYDEEYDEERSVSAPLPLVRFGQISAPLATDLGSNSEPDEAETAIIPAVLAPSEDRLVPDADAAAQAIEEAPEDAPEDTPPVVAASEEPKPATPEPVPLEHRSLPAFVVVAIEEPAAEPEQPLAVEQHSPPMDEPAPTLDESSPAVEDIAPAVSEPAIDEPAEAAAPD